MKSLLIVKVGAIGDVIMALPILSMVKKQFPSCKITWVSGKVTKPLLTLFPVDEIIEVDEKKLFKGSFFARLVEVFLLWKKIGFFRKFSLVLIGYFDLRYRLIPLWAFGKKRALSWKSRRLPIEGRFFSDEYVRLFSQKEGPEMERAEMPSFSLPYSEKVFSLLSKKKGPLIALSPGGAKNILSEESLKRWPIEYYKELSESLLKEGFSVVITGNRDDEWIMPYFSNEIINLVGQTDLIELLAVYQKSLLAVTHDSGSFHLARLGGNKVLALFGPTSPYRFAGDRDQKVRWLWGGSFFPCRPCYDGKSYARCKENACLKSITPKQVLEEIKKFV